MSKPDHKIKEEMLTRLDLLEKKVEKLEKGSTKTKTAKKEK